MLGVLESTLLITFVSHACGNAIYDDDFRVKRHLQKDIFIQHTLPLDHHGGGLFEEKHLNFGPHGLTVNKHISFGGPDHHEDQHRFHNNFFGNDHQDGGFRGFRPSHQTMIDIRRGPHNSEDGHFETNAQFEGFHRGFHKEFAGHLNNDRGGHFGHFSKSKFIDLH